jgi:hypothetical protein
MTLTPFSLLALDETFNVLGPNGGLMRKHSASLAIDLTTGEKIRFTATDALVERWDDWKAANDMADAEAVEMEAPVVETPEAVSLGKKAIGYLRTHSKKPFGDKGVQVIVDTVIAAIRAAGGTAVVRA